MFNRTHQSFQDQKKSPNLILARKDNHLIYEGAPVCQSFGNEHFYYTSSMMNCVYDCEYCYLQGMYPSANIVIFVNLEDIFSQVDHILTLHPVYLCISYDTDLLAFEHLLGYVKKWIAYAKDKSNLTIEIRTKSANIKALAGITTPNNVILAWTLSPSEIVKQYENYTPSYEARMDSIKTALKEGYRVRLCFDPMLYVKDFKNVYQDFFMNTLEQIPVEKIEDISIGVFRTSSDYLKNMRKGRPNSAIVQYPYENDHGVFHYGKERSSEMIDYAVNIVKRYIPEEKIFLWKENEK